MVFATTPADMPNDIRVLHETRYSYDQPTSFGPHRLMLRPRDSFDIRILRTGLTIDPPAQLTWMHDVLGNSVAIATFSQQSKVLSISSELILRRYLSTSPRDAAGPWMGGAPVAYSDADRFVLSPFIAPATDDPHGTLAAFAGRAVSRGLGSGHPLLDLSQEIHDALGYTLRFEEGTQAPLHSLEFGQGSCRDFAWLFIECARRLGYAARFVSGYLHNVARNYATGGAPAAASEGFSHAWAEVYVPGDGWIEFDPTNSLVADRQLIRVAVTRTPEEAVPISGSFTGAPGKSPPQVRVLIEPFMGYSGN